MKFEKCRVGILPARGSGGFNRKRSQRTQEIEPVRVIAISLRFIAVAIAPASACGGRDQKKMAGSGELNRKGFGSLINVAS